MFMDNNLNTMILRSGISKRIVAEQKGIQPETLSRHISGKIQLNLNDAEDYARILDCSPQEVLFATDPAPILGYVHYNKTAEHTIDWLKDRKKNNAKYPGSATRARNAKYPGGDVYLPSPNPFEVGAVLFNIPDDYDGPWIDYKDSLCVVQLDPIKQGYVSKDSIQQASYAKIKGGGVLHGHVYPEPGGTYTVYNPWRQDLLTTETEMQRGLKLDWAAPVIASFWQPLLRGIDIVYDKD